MDFGLVENEASIIKVIGVGGGGGNAVNYMYQQGIKDVDFVICNTDAQALAKSNVPKKIQLGESLTEGRGAGNKPEKGEQSAIEKGRQLAGAVFDIVGRKQVLNNSDHISASSNKLAGIIHADPADGYYRNVQLLPSLLQQRLWCGFGTRFGCRGEKRAKGDIISALLLSLQG